MDIAKKRAAAVVAALLAGCAGGTGEPTATSTSGTPPATQQQPQACTCIGLACLIYGCMPAQETASSGGTTASSFPPPPPPASFTSWTALERDRTTEAPGVSMGLSWQRAPIESVSALPLHEAPEDFRYDGTGGLQSIGVFSNPAPRDLAPLGHAGIDALQGELLSGFPRSDFTSLEATNVGVVANPYALGWDYQSFGAWTNQGIPGGNVNAVSFGAPSPAAAIPVSGSATFSGKLAGLYLSPTGQGASAAADLRVSVDFQARSLGFASSGSVLTRDFASATAAPNLDLSGTLTYVAGANAFSGTLVSAGGTMSGSSHGRFYGPAAQELGGAFALRSPTGVESFAGAYGAKR